MNIIQSSVQISENAQFGEQEIGGNRQRPNRGPLTQIRFVSAPSHHSRLLLLNIRCLISAALKKTGPVIPRKTIYRLSIYLRCLARLRENGIGTVSSEALAKAAGVKSTQLRKDLAYFGTFGTRGLGYDVAELSKKIADELGTSRLQPVILVGVGHLGLALLSYRGFEKEGFEIVAAFDAEPRRHARQKNQAADSGHGRAAGIRPAKRR